MDSAENIGRAAGPSRHHGDANIARLRGRREQGQSQRTQCVPQTKLIRELLPSGILVCGILVRVNCAVVHKCRRTDVRHIARHRIGATLRRMANDTLPGEQPGQLEALLERWQISLDLHARYAALDDARYWHVQPWPKHERPQRWIIQLARKRILALKRIVAQRQAEGDRAFIEGIETMGFLATLVGLTSVERFIPLATHETERREVLAREAREPRSPPAPEAAADRAAGATTAPRAMPASRTGEHRRTAETTRQMPALPHQAERVAGSAPARRREPRQPPQPRREARREAQRPAAVKPKKVAVDHHRSPNTW